MIKEARQDLFRAETKLNFERAWRWPIRAACVALGVVGVLAWQNDDVRTGFLALVASFFSHVRESGVEMLITFLVAGVLVWGTVFLVRRWKRGPTPEQQARLLMEQFASKDGVAAYVFAGQDNPEQEAAVIGALTRPENKRFRQRRLTHDKRPLASQITRLLNQQLEGSEDLGAHGIERAPRAQAERA
jgi:hypothetical protein